MSEETNDLICAGCYMKLTFVLIYCNVINVGIAN